MAKSRKIDLTLTVPTTASTTTAGTAVKGFGNCDAIKVIATLKQMSAGTLDVYIQHSIDGGTTWYDVARFPQLTAGSSTLIYDFSLSLDSTIRAVGSGTTPALGTTAGVVCGGPWGDQLRLVSVTGSGTNAATKDQVVSIFLWEQNK